MKSILVIIIIAAYLIGCSTNNNTESKSLLLAETRWEISSINSKSIDKSRIYFLLKENGKFTGNAGCNSMGGIYTITGPAIKFSNVISTKMSCDDIDKEVMFLKAIRKLRLL